MDKGGVSTPCRAVSIRGIVFSFPGGRIRRCMEALLTQGWNFMYPAYGETSTIAQGATHAVHWIFELQPLSNQCVKLKVGDTVPPAGLPIEQVLGEYSLSFLRRDVALSVSTKARDSF